MKSKPKFKKNECGFDGIEIIVEKEDGTESKEIWTFADLAIAINTFKTQNGYIME